MKLDDMFGISVEEVRELINGDEPSIPRLAWSDEKQAFDSLVIVPSLYIHDSGYRCMTFIAFYHDEPIGFFDYGSDVICLDGIGGYGVWKDIIPNTISPKGWRMDMFPNGCLRIFCDRRHVMRGNGLSTFELYAINKEANK